MTVSQRLKRRHRVLRIGGDDPFCSPRILMASLKSLLLTAFGRVHNTKKFLHAPKSAPCGDDVRSINLLNQV
jgi:spore coat polysaccharide biosynthesis protein SpsF (cytidylyltransferase family)